MREIVSVALGDRPAELAVCNVSLFDPFTGEWIATSFAVHRGIVAGLGEYEASHTIDLHGARVVPGLIDSHVHIESSLLCPQEFGRLVLPHGTTTVVADPHEIANVAGTAGLDWMLAQRRQTPLDIFYMAPSCVPATPLDLGGAVLTADDLARYVGTDGILGLAEMMNVPGVLSGDPGITKKLSLFSLIDGHAPLLSGKELNAYICAGIQSDHECTVAEEACEKLRKGMYLMVREGSTEKNIETLASVVDWRSAPRCSLATDDRHLDILAESGHIDDCIRKAVSAGIDLESALRMATLSAADRFALSDRGAVAPGRIADFCVLAPGDSFLVERTFKRGVEISALPYCPPEPITVPVACAPLKQPDLRIDGSGAARVIGLVEGQIITAALEIDVDGARIPDFERDILKCVVCDRYRASGSGVALVHGFGLQKGAIAQSISHDAHNIVCVGTSDTDIIAAVSSVAGCGGGIAAVCGEQSVLLPLNCGGLMSSEPCEEVTRRFSEMKKFASDFGGIDDPLMYLSFLALTVIPHLRVTERGLFDVSLFQDVPLFLS
jgi:adenine deaminase